MALEFLGSEKNTLPANVLALVASVDASAWSAMARQLKEEGARLLTLWGTDDRDRDGRFRIHAAFLVDHRIDVLVHALEQGASVYPALSHWFPVADRLQRAVYDLIGLEADGGGTRPWINHGGWPESYFPLRRDGGVDPDHPATTKPYPFVRVSGEGVHEIAVGPIHAGTIEPGHFRFSVVGEKVLRLEARLGYTHKGVAKRFETLALQDGHRLAARICGDSSVAYAWAYCAALEAIAGTWIPARAAALRALALERERLANHLGDLGALGNDAGLAFGLTQFSSLKERLLRVNQEAFGQRYLFDYLVPGGVAVDLGPRIVQVLFDEAHALEEAVSSLRGIYDNHAGLQDRFKDTGRLDNRLAIDHGALGLVGRASGVDLDLRCDTPWPPYDHQPLHRCLRAEGDVAARVQLRFDEVMESLRWCRSLLENLPVGPSLTALPGTPPNQLGLGLVEGWRGPVMVALETGVGDRIRRCHAHDSSWQNWPLLEHAVIGNIVPDFPLINKSFNLAYSGHDG